MKDETSREAVQEDDALAAQLGQIADLFTEAVARGERPSIDAYAKDHPELAPLLRQVLPAIEAMRSSTPSPALSGFAMPATLGDYRLLREIGRGGMGIVYEAEQISFPRKVALKLLPIQPGLNAQSLARFEREARTAAGLHHTHIVPVYAVGQEQGVHYYAMQFIEGRGLDQELAGRRADGAARCCEASLTARIGMQVAEALEYAHQRGIVHRDIKPSNILLQSGNLQSAIPLITDFGLVKNLDDSDNLTRTGDLVGTARYMSPEQTSARHGVVDGRSDVYSLGVTLYEMLTLRPAFDGADHATVLRQLEQSEPPPPRQLNRAVPRDLETIVLKAMAKSPADRYRTAGDLAAELRRFLAGEPIQARPLSTLERLRRWRRRNPLVAGLTGAVALSLVIGSLVSTYFAVQASRREQDALRERDRADLKANEAKASAEQARGEKRMAERHLYVASMNLAEQAWERGHVGRARQLLNGLKPSAGQEDLRGFDWHYFWRLSHRDAARWQAHDHAVSCLAYSPGGRLLVTGSFDGTLRVWDPERGLPLKSWRAHDAPIRAIAFAPEGLTLATGSQDRSVKIWDVATGQEEYGIAIGEAALALAVSPDGWLAVGTLGGSIRLFDAAGQPSGSLTQPGAVRAVTFSPDGQTLAGAGQDHLIRLWDVKKRELTASLEGHRGELRALTFSPDSLTLASAGYDQVIKLWDVTIGMPTATLRGHDDTISALAFSPDGQTLASAEGDPSHLFLPKEELRSRPGSVRSRPGEVKLWDVATGLERGSLRRHTGPVYCLAYHPDGERLASGGDDMSVVVWDVASEERTQLPGHLREVNAVAFSPDGTLLGSASDDRTVRLWDAITGMLKTTLRLPANIKAIAFAPDGRTFAAGGGSRIIYLRDTATGEIIRELKGHATTVRALAYSPDGRWLASCAGDPNQKQARPGEIKLWDAATGQLRFDLKGHQNVVRGIAFSPDGRTLASGSDDRTVKLWDVAAGQFIGTIDRPDEVRWVSFSPDGRTVAIAGGDPFIVHKPGEVVLWDLAAKKPRAALEGHRATVLIAVFAPDGQTLATGSSDGTVRLWDAVTGQERALLEGHRGQVRALAISKDGQRLATGDSEAMIRLWFGPMAQ